MDANRAPEEVTAAVLAELDAVVGRESDVIHAQVPPRDRMHAAGRRDSRRSRWSCAGELAEPGVTTEEMDREAEALIRKRRRNPAVQRISRLSRRASALRSMKKSSTAFPGARKLKDGDILSVDVGVRLGGYCADAAVTVPVGEISAGGAAADGRLPRGAGTRHCSRCEPGMRLSSDLSGAIRSMSKSQGYSVVREYTGHGIGREMHEEPQVPNFCHAARCRIAILPEGAVLAIEPMVNAGGAEVRRLANGWTVVTTDRSLSAHFEHTVAITAERAEDPDGRREVGKEAWRRKNRSGWKRRSRKRFRTPCFGWRWKTGTRCWRTCRAGCG